MWMPTATSAQRQGVLNQSSSTVQGGGLQEFLSCFERANLQYAAPLPGLLETGRMQILTSCPVQAVAAAQYFPPTASSGLDMRPGGRRHIIGLASLRRVCAEHLPTP